MAALTQWENPLNEAFSISVLTKTLPTKGNIVYEYNPFRNYRLSKDMYEYKSGLYSLQELKTLFGIILKDDGWYIDDEIMTKQDELPTCRMRGELVDFITDELSFDLEHPVSIIPEYSYDGSVNLILNDGKNQPRLINSRFSATGKNTYEIIDRKGNNDTNIYDQGEAFEIDTSLYKRVINIPTLVLNSVSSGGNLKCGNYHFYFKYSDADGNETDFVAESGLVSIFVGDQDPGAVYTGNKDENAVKQVNFILSNIDASYNYVSVYYSRKTAEDGLNAVTFYKKIDKKFIVNNQHVANIVITGFEDDIDVTQQDINLHFNVVDAACASATAQSMLFLANVHKPDIPYDELTDLSLRFLPYLKNEVYNFNIDEEYTINSTSKGYYDPKFIYNNVGYWNKELYRVGIVYILSNGELSPVFNIRGGTGIKPYDDPSFQFSQFNFENEDGSKIKIEYNEQDYTVIPPSNIKEGTKAKGVQFENVKGVIQFNSPVEANIIHALDIRVEYETIERLKALGIRGYFFVRQTRIPTILAEGITLGLDKEGRVPTIPVRGDLSVIEDVIDEINGNTFVETENILGLNFLSEGFMTRYKYEIEAKHTAGKWIRSICLGIGIGATVGLLTGLVFAGAAVGAGIIALTKGGDALKDWANTRKPTQKITEKATRFLGRQTKLNSGYRRKEIKDSRLLEGSFRDRVIIKDITQNEIGTILVPEYTVDQPLYNQLFTGGDFVLKRSAIQSPNFCDTVLEYDDPKDKAHGERRTFYYFSENNRHFYMPSQYQQLAPEDLQNYQVKLLGVPDSVSCLGIDMHIFRSRAGWPEEAWRYECIGNNYKEEYESPEDDVEITNENEDIESSVEDNKKDVISNYVEEINSNKMYNSDIVRGAYGPYVGMTGFEGNPGETVQIMIPGYSESNMKDYIEIRMHDSSPYYAISERIDIKNITKNQINSNKFVLNSQVAKETGVDKNYSFIVHRGDCYICQFTQRIFRNFNDPTAPYNDVIIDPRCWRNNYDINHPEKFEKINLGDINAVREGMWVTFTVRSSKNLNIRSLDKSNLAEAAESGHPRGFFPYHGLFLDGSYKIPESQVYNKGFETSVSERINVIIPDVPHIKNWFGTRIMYSNINITDAYQNGYRVFTGTNYRDYTRQYGEITKLVNLADNLLVIFEHGIALIPVNERAVAAQGQGGMAYINTSNVLPEHPNIISESYGSQWADSILVTPQDGEIGAQVFGVDTVAKKIWRVQNSSFQILSNVTVQEFLNRNITLGERELTPILGIRNVKTTYNAFKHDVMFTFYDNLTGPEEKVWNLCYNLNLNKFITFYSWVPSFMDNIDNIPFSFNRDVSKWIAKLGISHSENSWARGITLSNNIFENDGTTSGAQYTTITYLSKQGSYKTKNISILDRSGLVGVLGLTNHVLPQGQDIETFCTFELERDIYGNYKNYEIRKCYEFEFPKDAKYAGMIMPVYGLYFKPKTPNKLYFPDHNGNSVVDDDEQVYLSKQLTLANPGSVTETYQFGDHEYSTYFSEYYYRNKAGHSYADWEENKVTMWEVDKEHCKIDVPDNLKSQLSEYIDDYSGKITLDMSNYFKVVTTMNLPPFKNRKGERLNIPDELNPFNAPAVSLLNIKANIYAYYQTEQDFAQYMEYMKQQSTDTVNDFASSSLHSGNWINVGEYESQVAVTSKWNLSLLSTDFWKHGQAGLIDIADDIFPTKWYGKTHPFEFEFIVVDDPGTHKVFQTMELVANKAVPHSFHYEIVGECYDFAKDKANIFFRQEARKALWQYNGVDIEYDRNFLKIDPCQQLKSAELIHTYVERQNNIDRIEDSYVYAWSNQTTQKQGYDYSHLSGAEIVYYPNRQEYRIWQHQPAINLADIDPDSSHDLTKANCNYLEDKWKITINPILVAYKNEYTRKGTSSSLLSPENSDWATNNQGKKLPPITIFNTNIPEALIKKNEIEFPNPITYQGKTNALYGLYPYYLSDGSTVFEEALDTSNWLNSKDIYKTSFGEAQNRKEVDLKDKFLKVRIRYSGEELAVIDWVNTIFQISYA